MKNKIIITFALVMVLARSVAQQAYSLPNDSSGIYMTYNDVISGKVTHGFMRNQKGYSIWPKGFFVSRDPELKTPEKRVVFRREAIWGYTDHKGRLIRVSGKFQYRVFGGGDPVIYIKYSSTSPAYYFSRTLDGPIYRLTRRKLREVYAADPDFLTLIDSTKRKEWLDWADKPVSLGPGQP